MTPKIQSLFEAAESGPKGYNAYNRGTKTDAQGVRNIIPATRDIDFSALTLKEVMARQKLPKSNTDSVFAVGLYQLTPDTTKHAVEALKLKDTEKFTPELQDRIFSDYLLQQKRPAIAAYIRNEGKNSLKSAQHELSKEWAGMPDPYKDGASHYGKGTSNKAHVTLDVSKNFLEDLRADYAQLRKDGLSKTAAWSGLFDGRTIVHTPEGVAAPTPETAPTKKPNTPSKKPTEDEPGLLDDLKDIPLFKSMQDALEKITGPALGKRLDEVLENIDERAILGVVDKSLKNVGDAASDSLKALNEKFKQTMSDHIPIQITPKAIATPVYPVPVKRTDVPLPALTQVPKQDAVVNAAAVTAVAERPACVRLDDHSQRLLHQVEAQLAGEAGQKLGAMSEADATRLLHAVVAEARVSGFKHVVELQVTKDRNGLIAFDGAPDSPASRRLYVDRAQAAAQSLERSAAIINVEAVAIEQHFTDAPKQTAQLSPR